MTKKLLILCGLLILIIVGALVPTDTAAASGIEFGKSAKANALGGVMFLVPHSSMNYARITFAHPEAGRLAITGYGDVFSMWLVDSSGQQVWGAYYEMPETFYDETFCLFGPDPQTFKQKGFCEGWPAELPPGDYEFWAYSDPMLTNKSIRFDPNAELGGKWDIPNDANDPPGFKVIAHKDSAGSYAGSVRMPGSSGQGMNFSGSGTDIIINVGGNNIPDTADTMQVQLGWKTATGWSLIIHHVEINRPNRK